jgi:6-phosphogluconolactonase
MELEVLPDAEAVAVEAARRVAAEARAAAAARGCFAFAVSGGSTPWKMLALLAKEELPWKVVHLFQVDERVAPEGDPDRNLTQLRESLLAGSALPESHVHAMPVNAEDLEAAARDYAELLEKLAGTPPVLDLVHLGLGLDGHTASLVPGDPVCEVRDRDVAVTAAPYQGRRRMTLTFPLLDRARKILWLATGASKLEMLARLRRADASIPGGRVRSDRALVLADREAVPSEAGASVSWTSRPRS